ncbi:MAG: hypothetical protein JKY98_04550 [Gammaproteobacteria bacterium]|nr:hypothetical protein [Gammaproteobacteria bacterium]
MSKITDSLTQAFLAQEKLPGSFADTIEAWYLPLVNRLLSIHRQHGPGLLVGINGAQGTGKSTLAKFLALVFQQQQLRVANLSLDDFYLSHHQREQLARRVHPLLVTRGVPGTHDIASLNSLVKQLHNPKSSGRVLLPRFNKLLDNPCPETQWEKIQLPVDIILLEGWFVGVMPQNEADLVTPVNPLEAEKDEQGTWRQYVNLCLADYQPLFDSIDFLIMLEAPSFDCVYQWRSLQEEKLKNRMKVADSRSMDSENLKQFIQHFERLTLHGLEQLPARADLVFHLDRQHRISRMSQ